MAGSAKIGCRKREVPRLNTDLLHDVSNAFRAWRFVGLAAALRCTVVDGWTEFRGLTKKCAKRGGAHYQGRPKSKGVGRGRRCAGDGRVMSPAQLTRWLEGVSE